MEARSSWREWVIHTFISLVIFLFSQVPGPVLQGLGYREAVQWGAHMRDGVGRTGWPKLGSGVCQEVFLREAKSEWGLDSSLELPGGEEGGAFPEKTGCD